MSKFKEMFKGFDTATPDGGLLKLNAPGMDGKYEFVIKATSTFTSHETKGETFKAEIEISESDNPKVKPGSLMSLLHHGLTDPKEYNKAKALGNVKGLLAAALTNLEGGGEEIDAADQSMPWMDWIVEACESEGFLAGARVGVQVTTRNAQTSKKDYGHVTYIPILAAKGK
jgi:hypothetical protein